MKMFLILAVFTTLSTNLYAFENLTCTGLGEANQKVALKLIKGEGTDYKLKIKFSSRPTYSVVLRPLPSPNDGFLTSDQYTNQNNAPSSLLLHLWSANIGALIGEFSEVSYLPQFRTFSVICKEG